MTKFGRTPLHVAARTQGVTAALVSTAVEQGGINTRDDHGFSPLYTAAMFNDTAAVELLLSNRADTGSADLGGLTPLHIACEKGRTEAAVLLLRGNANPEAKDSINRTPLEWAIAKGHEATCAALHKELQ